MLSIWLLATIVTSCTLIRQPVESPETPEILHSTALTPIDGWYDVYFCNPDSPTAGTFRGGPDDALAKAIRDARLSVDAAIYHLNLWSIRDALIAAHQAGTAVRVVVESDNLDEVEIQELREAGIEVLGDRRESLMHNKFVIIDRSDVWTGSMNFTTTGAYFNDNNLIHIRFPSLAENYTTEFDEMFVSDMFGDDVVIDTPFPVLSLDHAKIETYFSPDDNTAGRIIELIRQARDSLVFMMYSFTSDDIADAILERAAAGVHVVGIFEESQYLANIGTEFDRLVDAGLEVHLDGNPRNMHHKVMIIDGNTVITGSYNFSQNAEVQNDENTLVIHNGEIAALYTREFERVFSHVPAE